jgi:hypothetical protein
LIALSTLPILLIICYFIPSLISLRVQWHTSHMHKLVRSRVQTLSSLLRPRCERKMSPAFNIDLTRGRERGSEKGWERREIEGE